MASIAKLVVSLGANVAGFETDMQRATRNQKQRMREMEQSVAAAGKAIAIAFTAAAGAVTAMVASTTKSADSMAKLGQRLGASTEALSELGYVAEKSGVDFRTLEMGLQRMTRRIGEVAFLGKGEAKVALEKLGLEAKNLAELPLDKQFEAIAQKLSEVGNTSQRTSLAMKIFDAEGVKLVQLMGDGAAGIQKLREEMERTGAVISTDLAAASVEFNDNLALMGRYAEGARNQFVEGLLPSLIGLQRAYLDSADSSDTFKYAGEKLGDVLLTVARFAVKLWGVLQTLSAALIGLGVTVVNAVRAILAPVKAAVGALSEAASAISEGRFADAWESLKTVGARSAREFEQALDGMRNGIDEVAGSTVYYERAAARADKMTNKWEKSADEASSTANELTGNYEDQATALRRLADEQKKVNELQEQANEYVDSLVAAEEEWNDSVRALLDELYPLERLTREYNVQLQYLRDYAAENAWTADQLADAEARLAKRFDEATGSITRQSDAMKTMMDESVRILERTFADMWTNLLDGSLDVFDGIVDGFKGMLAKMLHEASTQKIVIAIQDAFAGKGMNWQEFMSGVAGLAAVYGGSALGGGGQYATSGSSTGAAIGSIFGPWGTVIGGLAGGLFGGLADDDDFWSKNGGSFVKAAGMEGFFDFFDKLTGLKFEWGDAIIRTLLGVERPAVAKIFGNQAGVGRSNSDLDNVFKTAFGEVFLSTRRLESDAINGIIESVTAFDDAIADLLDAGTIEAISQQLKAWGLRMEGAEISLENILGARLEVVLANVSEAIGAFVAEGYDLKEKTDRLLIGLQAERIIEEFSDIFKDRTIDDLFGFVERFKTASNTIGEAFEEAMKVLERVVGAQSVLRQYIDTSAADTVANLMMQQGRSLVDTVVETQAALGEAIANYDGSIGQLENIAQLAMQAREGEIALLQTIDAIQKGLTQSLDDLRNEILGVGVEKKGYELFDEALKLIGAVNQAQTPEEIARLGQEFQALIRAISPEDQARMRSDIVAIIDMFQAAADSMLASMRATAESNAESTRDLVDIFLTDIGDPLDILASSNQQVATELGSIDESINNLGPVIEESIRQGFGGANINVTVVVDRDGLVNE